MATAGSSDQQRLYDDLAWTWPIISPPADYVPEAERARELIQGHLRTRARTLLHLGCGGGHLDFTLKRHIDVTGVDVSEAMLSLARRLNPNVSYVAGDMRTVRLGRTFDAAAVFDSIDYMLTLEDLRAAFETAHAHLEVGGVFLTYAEQTTERFRQNETRVTSRSADGVDITFIENAFDPDPGDWTFENTFVYLIRRGGRLDIETDRHLSGLFPFQTWIDLLEETGFEVTTVGSDPGDEEKIPWFVCVKSR